MVSKTPQLKLSKNAAKALAKLSQPLIVECELYFSCLIRIRLLFPGKPPEGAISLTTENNKIDLYFRPIMTKNCSGADVVNEPDVETFPIKKPEAFIPRYVDITYKNGKWLGDFSYQ